jgi:hypothetical protein
VPVYMFHCASLYRMWRSSRGWSACGELWREPTAQTWSTMCVANVRCYCISELNLIDVVIAMNACPCYPRESMGDSEQNSLDWTVGKS